MNELKRLMNDEEAFDFLNWLLVNAGDGSKWIGTAYMDTVLSSKYGRVTFKPQRMGVLVTVENGVVFS